MAILISLLVFATVVVVVYSMQIYSQEKQLLFRLQEGLQKVRPQRTIDVKDILRSIAKPLSRQPQLQKYRTQIETQIRLSGKTELDSDLFVGIQIVSGIFCAILLVLVFGLVNILFLIVFLCIGLVIPLFWLRTKVQIRHKKLFRALPDCLDLLTLMMEAGLDFTAALNKFIEKGEKGPLWEELFIMQQEIQMGKSRVEALNDLSTRTNHPAVSSVISSLVQGIQLGSSLGPILKSQAEQLRTQRFQIAEKMAAEAPLKLLFPLLFFIFPTVFIVLFGPIILSFLR